ncbi:MULTISPECIES: class I SAM-dependent methyltransferase [Metabacillus]|uniref:SAM-dependent methyltransferase n=2 Tax=Metabacillus TaxID=2675233 RepID=A0A179T676_9BACI|nr:MULTISPECIES: class I SAM-dependent methyltransferase [Metabacillus]OAS89535.1 SAM-dependent methyltransferase [Metabacillus litoralis]QNF29057.1 methyltransferase domain-containing protein [Metabacillus sp. KUDC1714]
MNLLEYERFYDKVGRLNGWDFSKVKSISEGVKWGFYTEVTKRCKNTDVLLDIGTGGGENILKIAGSLQFLVGIDLSNGMMETALSNLRKSNLLNVRFCQMSSDDLQFPTGFFDVISCCHAPFYSIEVAKVLRSGGLFLTQQVSEADKLNVKEAFGRGQSFGEIDGALKEKYIRELIEVGFSDVKSFDYDAMDYYQRPEDLIFLLKHTPIIPNFGQEKKDFEILNDFIKNNQTEKGIRTNSKRFLIIAKK